MEDRISAIRAEGAKRGLLRRKTANELFVPYCYQATALLTSYGLWCVTDHPACQVLILAVMIWMFVSIWRI